MKDLTLIERREGDLCLVKHDKFGLALATLQWLKDNKKRVYNIGYISTIQVKKKKEFYCYHCKQQFQYKKTKYESFEVVVEEIGKGKTGSTTCEVKGGETSTIICPHCNKETGLWPNPETITGAKKKQEEKLINVATLLMTNGTKV